MLAHLHLRPYPDLLRLGPKLDNKAKPGLMSATTSKQMPGKAPSGEGRPTRPVMISRCGNICYLLSHQRIPKVLGSRRAGEVVVEFVIDRHGQLIKQLMGKSSGIHEFDRAARRMVQEAAPYPAAPAELQWQQRLYRITVRYAVQ